ncbi:MAG TPA: cyclase family protein, partial [Gemmataceae bacterium]|nr:cyclase family protein [Gemmataceae bacterium]
MIYDVSPPLSPRLAVWPGDTPLTREVLAEIGPGSAITLSSLRATAHLGAHADAPSHYGAGAPSIDARALDLYLGPCQLIRVAAARGCRLTPDAIRVPIIAVRVLIDTGT